MSKTCETRVFNFIIGSDKRFLKEDRKVLKEDSNMFEMAIRLFIYFRKLSY